MKKLEVHSYKRVLTNLRLLCGLRLEGRAIMPTLLRDMRWLVGSEASHFVWLDEDRQPLHYCSHLPSPPEYGFTLISSWLVNQCKVCALNASGYLIVHPANEPTTPNVLICTRERMLGVIILHRRAGDPEFSDQEKKRLAMLVPHIILALTNSIAAQPALVDTDEEGLIIADDSGQVLGLTPLAQRLLHEVRAFDSLAVTEEKKRLPAPLALLCDQAMQPSPDDHDAKALLWSHQNPLGPFVFRAHCLPSPQTLPGKRLIGITIHHQEPLVLKRWRKIDTLPLSFRETQFCLLMASDYPQAAIADHMNISVHTAIAHRRHLYTKLGVHNRAEMMSRLLAL